MNTVSAITLRRKLGEIMDSVYHTGEEVIVERKGKPYIRIVSIKKEDKKSFLDLAGAWKNLDTDKMIKDIYDSRKDGSRKKKYLLKW